MKCAVSIHFALAALSAAVPLAQFSLPSFGAFSIPSFPRPTGGFSLPSFPGATKPATSSAIPTRTGTTIATPTGSAGGGAVGGNCTPQSSSGGSTEKGVTDGNCCTDMTVIFARGTGESGNVGTVSGPPMFKSLRQKLGADRVTIQGVDYPADAAGNANLGASGGPTMAKLVQTALTRCPSTKIVLSGYSQGAMVVHNAFSQGISSSQIGGIVLFGDPLIRQPVGDVNTSKVKEFCGSSDTVCGQPTGDVNGGHLSYGSVAGAAADAAIKFAGL